MIDLDAIGWPLARAGEALQALAVEAGLPARPVEVPPLAEVGESEVAPLLDRAASWLGLEVEAVEAPYVDLDALVRGAAPSLVLLRGATGLRLVAVVSGGRRPRALAPDLTVRRVEAVALRTALARPLEAPLDAELERLIDATGIAPRRRARLGAAILRQRLGGRRVGGVFLVGPRPGSSFAELARRARLPGRLGALVAAHLGEYALYVLSWWLIGRGALDGRLDSGWLYAWLLLLITLIPFRLLATGLAGELACSLGALLKQRLLVGALALEPEEVRHLGAGQLLGRVLESGSVETLAIGGGLAALTATLELGVAAAIVGAGAAGLPGTLALVAWLALAVGLAWRYLVGRRWWTERRLEMTHDLVERMVGHRTRLAQEPVARWHDGEDQALERYLEGSRQLDRVGTRFVALVPRGWLVVGVATLGPAFVAGHASAAQLAVSLGGILLAYRALHRLGQGLHSLVGAAIAWRQVSGLWRAAERVAPPSMPAFALPRRANTTGQMLIEAHDLVYRYRDRGKAVLRDCSVQIAHGERLLVEGPSGGGKSTLASLLAGLRVPESGLLLLDGLDRHTLGLDGWRARVVAAPQFHENHVLVGTFAFNLLLGRAWPPSPQDLDEAEAVCRELGLSRLLSRMPAGLMQMVGETGWQLSHGERSRLYIARALLQRSDLILLDESFAALDPETLRTALECVLARAASLLVVAHP